MGTLLLILFATLALGIRTRAVGRRARLAGGEVDDGNDLEDVFARTSLLVLFCLLGLLALGLVYGNVLGDAAPR